MSRLIKYLLPNGLLRAQQQQQQQQQAIKFQQPLRWLTQEQKDKQFTDKPTPYEKSKRACILCQNKIQLDYKNPRLLSQFISPLTGEIWDKHITGLCERQQTNLEREIRKSRQSMLMPIYYRNPKYNKDPVICNTNKPQRPNPH